MTIYDELINLQLETRSVSPLPRCLVALLRPINTFDQMNQIPSFPS